MTFRLSEYNSFSCLEFLLPAMIEEIKRKSTRKITGVYRSFYGPIIAYAPNLCVVAGRTDPTIRKNRGIGEINSNFQGCQLRVEYAT